METTNAPKGSINIKSLLHGLILAVGSFIVTSLGTMLNSGTIPTQTDLIGLGKLAGGVGLTYLISNFLQNSNGDFKPESESPIKSTTLPVVQPTPAPVIETNTPEVK